MCRLRWEGVDRQPLASRCLPSTGPVPALAFGERLDLAFEHGFGTTVEGGAVEDVPHRLCRSGPALGADGQSAEHSGSDETGSAASRTRWETPLSRAALHDPAWSSLTYELHSLESPPGQYRFKKRSPVKPPSLRSAVALRPKTSSVTEKILHTELLVEDGQVLNSSMRHGLSRRWASR